MTRIGKYEQTYLTSIKELVKVRGDKNAYEKLIKNIIKRLGKYYLAAFSFFIRTNASTESFSSLKKMRALSSSRRLLGKLLAASPPIKSGKENQLSLFEPPLEDKQCA